LLERAQDIRLADWLEAVQGARRSVEALQGAALHLIALPSRRDLRRVRQRLARLRRQVRALEHRLERLERAGRAEGPAADVTG
jgi:hypothetical protein